MQAFILTTVLTILMANGCTQTENSESCAEDCGTQCTASTDSSKNVSFTENESNPMVCSLTTPEMQKRKETVLADLKKAVLEKRELTNGYSYRFNASDEMIDKLTEFIKTERSCCGFFNFSIQVNNDDNAWLEITGEEGVKDFITAELEL